MGGPPAQVDFFISYTSSDRAWAEWIAWQLHEAGASVVLQAWDMVPGLDFVHEMHKATTTAKGTLAVLSPAYFTSQFSEAEWRVAFANDPSDEQRRLIPVRVVDFAPEGLLATRIYIDLVGKDRRTAQAALLDGVRGQPAAVPTEEPTFPGERPAGLQTFALPAQEPGFPGQGPSITNLPRRNPNFTGRRELLETLRTNLRAGARGAVVQTEAIHGLGGVGKTELTLEYAHRYTSDYDLAWWVTAEQPATVAASLVDLAGRLGIGSAGEPAETIRDLFENLRRRDRWLLVFDNAEAPGDVADYLPPGGSGHVLVTSRYAAWGQLAEPVRLDVLCREGAVAFVRKRTGSGDENAATELVEALGGLPLALEEAAAYIEATGIGLDDYRGLVVQRMVEMFGLGSPANVAQADERRVATIWSVSLERVLSEAPGAEALLDLCAFLAPDGIPRALPTGHADVLPEELVEVAGDPLRYNEAIRVLGRYSLVVATPETLGLHRLVQAVIRARLEEEAQRQWAEVAVELLYQAFPSDSWEIATWPVCQRLLPHLLAVTDHAERLGVMGEVTSRLLNRATTYLRGNGQPQEARPLIERALTLTQQTLGRHHPDMALCHGNLGNVLAALGDLTGARAEHERAIAIGEATLGPDHPDMAARHNDLGLVLHALGDLTSARAELQRAIATTAATLGPNHRIMAVRHNNLGLMLRAFGDLTGARAELQRAIAIGEATVGPDHPDMALLAQQPGQCAGRPWRPNQCTRRARTGPGDRPGHPRPRPSHYRRLAPQPRPCPAAAW
jgi:tetratricopeptide (TPR) repeat protein